MVQMSMDGKDSVIGGELRSRMAGVQRTEEGRYSCSIDFDPAFRGFEGHFPGNPIVPGVCLIEAGRVFAEEVLKRALTTRSVTQCRFRRPVFAGERAELKIKLEEEAEDLWKIQADIRVGGSVCAQVRLKAGAL